MALLLKFAQKARMPYDDCLSILASKRSEPSQVIWRALLLKLAKIDRMPYVDCLSVLASKAGASSGNHFADLDASLHCLESFGVR